MRRMQRRADGRGAEGRTKYRCDRGGDRNDGAGRVIEIIIFLLHDARVAVRAPRAAAASRCRLPRRRRQPPRCARAYFARWRQPTDDRRTPPVCLPRPRRRVVRALQCRSAVPSRSSGAAWPEHNNNIILVVIILNIFSSDRHRHPAPRSCCTCLTAITYAEPIAAR